MINFRCKGRAVSFNFIASESGRKKFRINAGLIGFNFERPFLPDKKYMEDAKSSNQFFKNRRIVKGKILHLKNIIILLLLFLKV